MIEELVLPDFLPYLAGILMLLVIWQYHQLQVMKGRIVAIDIFDRSGIRMYIHMVPNDPQTCDVCRRANGKVFLPSEVVKKRFSPLDGPCESSSGCTSLLIGLYGAWPEARHILERLGASKKKTSVTLSDQEIAALIGGPWEKSISAATDRIAVHTLEAVVHEGKNPDTSIMNYRYVIDQAREVRHLPYLIPAYFRLVELLTRQNRVEEAFEVIQQFEERYRKKKPGPYTPSERQRGLMSIRKSKLKIDRRSMNVAQPSTMASGM